MNEPVAFVDKIWIERPDLVMSQDLDMNKLFARSAREIKNYIPLYTHLVNPYQSITNTKIEPTVVSYTHPVKELTDEEILDTFDPHFDADIEDKELIKFARAILRKAQEK